MNLRIALATSLSILFTVPVWADGDSCGQRAEQLTRRNAMQLAVKGAVLGGASVFLSTTTRADESKKHVNSEPKPYTKNLQKQMVAGAAAAPALALGVSSSAQMNRRAAIKGAILGASTVFMATAVQANGQKVAPPPKKPANSTDRKTDLKNTIIREQKPER